MCEGRLWAATTESVAPPASTRAAVWIRETRKKRQQTCPVQEFKGSDTQTKKKKYTCRCEITDVSETSQYFWISKGKKKLLTKPAVNRIGEK